MTDIPQGKKAVTLMLFVIAFATLMDGLDGGIVNVALPVLAKDFGTDTGTIAWITVVYFIMIAGLMIPFARIAKNGNIKKVLFIGLIIFTASSFLCGISDNFQMLLAFRAIQGIGAAMMGAATPMICVRYLPTQSLGLGLGVLTLGSSIGFAAGPALGGIITDVLSWHWIFLINIPLGLLVLPLLFKAIPNDEKIPKQDLDLTGAVLLFMVIMFGALALERASYGGDKLLVLVSAAVFLVSITAFILTELKKRHPILNIRVFTHKRFDAVFVAFLLINVAYMGMIYLLPFYMNNTMDFSSSTSGAFLLIPPVITLVFCIPISKWSDVSGRRWFSVTACVMMLIAFASMAMFSDRGMTLPLILTLTCMGFVWAFCGGPMASRIVEEVSDESREIGSTLMNESIYIGATVGVALFAMIFTLGSGAGNVEFADLSSEIFLDGFTLSMITGVLISLTALIASFVIKDRSAR